jgi:superfamily II DNA/RNA helicase
MNVHAVAPPATFADLGLSEIVLKGLAGRGLRVPVADPGGDDPVYCCRGADILGQAQTGTGKTAAFALPHAVAARSGAARAAGAGARADTRACDPGG